MKRKEERRGEERRGEEGEERRGEFNENIYVAILLLNIHMIYENDKYCWNDSSESVEYLYK